MRNEFQFGRLGYTCVPLSGQGAQCQSALGPTADGAWLAFRPFTLISSSVFDVIGLFFPRATIRKMLLLLLLLREQRRECDTTDVSMVTAVMIVPFSYALVGMGGRNG